MRSDASARRRLRSSQPKVTAKVMSPSSTRRDESGREYPAIARFVEPQPIRVKRDEGRQTEEQQRSEGEGSESSDTRHRGHLVMGAGVAHRFTLPRAVEVQV